MAGIGFELKKLFQKRGLAATAKAYGYAGVICTGPMLLGIVLLVGIAFICDHTGATRHNRELLNCMITYTLLASLTVTSFFSMVVTRYIADMLYEERHEAFFFLGFNSDPACSRRNHVWDFSSVFRNQSDRSVFVPGVFRRIDRHLECDELSDSDQRLQRDSYFIYHSGSGIIVGRIPIDPDWDSTCRGVDDRSYDRLWNHAALGCDAVIFRRERSVHFSFYAGWISSFRLRLQACSRTSDYLHILLSCGADRSVYMFRDYFMVHRIMMYLR